MCPELASEQAFRSRNDLISQYGVNARLIFALQIKFQIDDIDSVATDALTDGPDDKKCDLIYVNTDDSYAVVAQSYESSSPCSGSAPSNKASDLNTAVSWLLNSPIDQISERIRPATEQLRNAISQDKINRIFIWYVHNCQESSISETELKIVEHTAASALHRHYSSHSIDVQSLEIGKKVLEEWYQSLNTPILVTDNISIRIPSGYEIQGSDWSSFHTTISAGLLFDLYNNYGTKLFSANIRDYLGSRNTDKNINNNIKITAEKDPDHFYIYNNGITALVNNYKINLQNGSTIVDISGISIVNGAQTTGAIGSLADSPNPSAIVSIRFVKCTTQDVIWNIIQYNNSQNKITASDFRSNDSVQRRLREEFTAIGGAVYLGGRRGGVQDRIRRQPNLISSDTVVQALASFHGQPTMAYNEKNDLWADDAKYNSIFSEKTHANHIIFVYSLLKCIEEKKRELRRKGLIGELTGIQNSELDFLRNRGANLLLHAAIAKSIETIIDRPVADKFRISFIRGITLSRAIDLWKPIVEATIPFYDKLNPGVSRSIQNKTAVNNAIDVFQSLVEATKVTNNAIFREFASNIQIN
jgi:hypothetical protein